MASRATAFVVAIVVMGAGLWLAPSMVPVQLWLLGAGLVGLIGVTTESFLGQPSASGLEDHLQAFSLWLAPGLLIAAALWLANISPESHVSLVLAGPALLGLLLLSLLVSLDPESQIYRGARFVFNLVVYLSAFLLFVLIYHTKDWGLLTAIATGVVALLAGIELMRPRFGDRASWLPVALISLVIAETTWALDYWPVGGLVGGALLLLAFYVFSGLLQSVRGDAMDRRMMAEYGAVGAVGFVLVLWAIPW